MRITSTMTRIVAAGLFLAGLTQVLRSADVSVTASLSRPEINSGDMAELQVKVTGAQQADVPQQIAVEGLQIRLTGQSTQVEMVNFKVSSSVVYSYIVMPLRTGGFTIPSVTVSADGRQFRTVPLSFKVLDSSSGGGVTPGPAGPQSPAGMPGFSQPRSRSQSRQEGGRIAFGEISCGKKSLYVGEMTPVEIRYYFDERYPVQIRGAVNFESEGILVERFLEPKEGREERDGILYNVLTFRSLLSAVKPGSIDIPPAKLDTQVQMPGALPPGFDDPVFQQLLGGRAAFGQTRDLAVTTAPLHLDVLPLPKEGRPASFAGAVGQFDIDAVVSNPNPSPGDPANLVVKIGGKGNFKGMGAPVLKDTAGWRTYPPTDKFDSSDELSYAGVKSFDFTLLAQQPKHVSPICEFSYFDPQAAKYVTRTTEPLPLSAMPGSAATPAPGSAGGADVGATGGGASVPSPTPRATPVSRTPLPGITLRSWETPARRPEFLIATLSMLVATGSLAGILWWLDLRSCGGTAAMRRKQRLSGLLVQAGSENTEGGAAYDAAVEYAGLVATPSEAREAAIASLVARRDLLKYGTVGKVPLSAPERETLLGILRSLTP